MVYQNLFAMAQPGGGSGGMMGTVIMFGLIIAIFYLMILRPQQKRQSERQKMVDAIGKGDKITTIGGMHGTVVAVEDNTVLVQIADNVKVKFDKTAVAVRKTDA